MSHKNGKLKHTVKCVCLLFIFFSSILSQWSENNHAWVFFVSGAARELSHCIQALASEPVKEMVFFNHDRIQFECKGDLNGNNSNQKPCSHKAAHQLKLFNLDFSFIHSADERIGGDGTQDKI